MLTQGDEGFKILIFNNYNKTDVATLFLQLPVKAWIEFLSVCN